jgi:hypothetical protein
MLPGALIFENGTTVLKRNRPAKLAHPGMSSWDTKPIENRLVTPIRTMPEGYQQELDGKTFSLWQIHS